VKVALESGSASTSSVTKVIAGNGTATGVSPQFKLTDN
jgi:hypothetical protein